MDTQDKVVPVSIFSDQRLGWDEKGLLVFFHSLGDREITRKQIERCSKEGIGAILSMLNTLRRTNYITRRKYSDGSVKYFLNRESTAQNC